jgi:hypothetical protein
VINLYLRDSLIDMTADESTRLDADSMHTDQIGKVFVVVGQDVRKCLVCEQFFSRRSSAKHANVPCYPAHSSRAPRR